MLRRKKNATPAEEPVAVVPVEDTGTRALSDALESSFKLLKLLMALLVVIFFLSGVFQVKQNEVAVILRFGKPVGDSVAEQVRKSGLHFAFPYPIDEVVKIPLGQSQTIASTAGWPAVNPLEKIGAEAAPTGDSLRPGIDGYTLTQDGNIIHVRAEIKYSVNDPVAYEFNFESAKELLQNALNNSIIYASAHFSADAALYKEKTAFKEKVELRLKQLVDTGSLGIKLEPINVETSAPRSVRAAFDAVLESEQERGRKISEAQGDANKITLEAVGEAQAVVSGGISRSNMLVQVVSTEARYFLDQLPHYKADPELFRQRLLIEKMGVILTNAQDKFYIPSRADGQTRELRLQLNPEPKKPGQQL